MVVLLKIEKRGNINLYLYHIVHTELQDAWCISGTLDCWVSVYNFTSCNTDICATVKHTWRHPFQKNNNLPVIIQPQEAASISEIYDPIYSHHTRTFRCSFMDIHRKTDKVHLKCGKRRHLYFVWVHNQSLSDALSSQWPSAKRNYLYL